MNSNFWKNLSTPIIGLSPMDGITDQPFRFITKKYGNPDLIYTEFTNVEGLCHGASELLKPLIYDESQRPIVAQIFGKTPKCFRKVAVLLCELGFDGIDINMGCPAKRVAQHGSGAALINNPKLAQEIIRETKNGVKDFGKKVPVSVKTRIGFDKPVTKEWISTLLECEPAAIALHGRTLKQAYGGKADWEEISCAADLVHQTKTLILGNGDIQNRQEAEDRCKQYNLDGVLIGRAAMDYPFVFTKLSTEQLSINKLAKIALEHSILFETTYSHFKNYSFLPMRKHLAWYIRGIDNASQIRQELMQTNSSEEVKIILSRYQLL